MIRARIATGSVLVAALAGCSHPGAPVATQPAPLPTTLDVAVTDAPDSIAAWLSNLGAYQLSARSGDTVHLEPVVDGAGPALVLHRVPARAARDALDAGVDVLLTSDPDAIAYAATRADLTSVPSDWNRAYGLLVRGDQSSDSEPGPARDTVRAQLATGAVRVEARPASVWSDLPCPTPAGASATNGMAAAAHPRIVYSRTDDVARSVAARLIALGSSRRELLAAFSASLVNAGDSLRAEGVDPGDVAREVVRGNAVAAVVAVPLPGCGASDVPGMDPALTHVVPLIETRERLIARRTLTARMLATLAQAIGDSARAKP